MRILIINFYSPRNLGDLAILEQTVWLARQVVPNAQFDVLVSDPPGAPEWLGVNWLPSWPVIARQRSGLHLVRKAHRQADLILSLGGGYFFVHDFRPFSTWATVSLAYALLWRRPVICLPQSFGPFRFAYQARLAAALMARCTEVYLRDPESLVLFRRFAPQQAQAHFAPDTAFSLALRWHRTRQPSAGRPQIGVTIVDWSFVDPTLRPRQALYEKALSETLRYAMQVFGAEVNLFLQCQSSRRAFESDHAVTGRVHAQLVTTVPTDALRLVNNLDTPQRAMQAYSTMDAFIATRLHSAIFASCAGVPALVIGYQPKSCATMHLLNQAEFCLPLQQVDAPALRAKLELLWSQREQTSIALSELARSLGHAAAACITSVIDRYRSK
ncbi:MAG: polysaccharide pyruvyl transferase family protein [Anaerolineae bacterium]|nr:polysaccharide pyruvyl transferase family protein [Anaerolineae bacterium]